MTSGTNSATYTFLANSPLVSQIVFTNGNVLRLTTTKSYDNLNRLTAISSSGTGILPVSFNYAYNNANQRTSVTNADSARWVYQYDALGQVVSGKQYWSDGTPVAGQQFEYTFDDIGNRKTTTSGGDSSGANLRSATYTANSLNQYSQRTVPGYVNILGTANSNATVTINLQSTYRRGDYFRGELSGDNSSAALWLSLTNLAVLNNGTNADIIATNTGNLLLAKTPESFVYDADGNLTSDGLWTNTWNGENRLMTMQSRSSITTAAKRKVDYAYDYYGRMIQRIVSTNDGSQYVANETNRFVYNGVVQLAELDGGNNLIKSYMRGLDLSGSLQGAGGAGGLLAINARINGFHFYCNDGNGNVVALVSASDGTASANYDYDPFGVMLRQNGVMAFINTFGFSSQYTDYTTRHILYLHRPYNPSTGRWLSRDPADENGGLNLYGFVFNDSENFFDPNGEAPSYVIGVYYEYVPGSGKVPIATGIRPPPPPPSPLGLGLKLVWHWAYGRGNDYIVNGGAWAQFLSSHPSVVEALDEEYRRLKEQIKAACQTKDNLVIKKGYVVKSSDTLIQDNWFLTGTLNQGHVAEMGTYVADCCHKTVTFTPSKTTYWDEVVWKIKCWVPDGWTTYPADAFVGGLSSDVGYVGSWTYVAPTFRQFYFEVNWNNGKPKTYTW